MNIQKTVSLKRLLSACYYISNIAAKRIRQIYLSNKFDIIEKGHTLSKGKFDDPQTTADVESQKIIYSSLSHHFPDIKIIAEEDINNIDSKDNIVRDINFNVLDKFEFPKNYSKINSGEIIIWVDPLDGTKEFVKKNIEAVTTLIGISYKNKAIAGIIVEPFINLQGEMNIIWGCKGVGSFGYSKPNSYNKDRRYIVTTSSHFSDNIKNYLHKCRADKILQYGGCGHKMMCLLKGEVDAYVFPSFGTKKWDTCAPQAILEAVGGKLTLPNGNDLVYDKNSIENTYGFVATINGEHDSYINFV